MAITMKLRTPIWDILIYQVTQPTSPLFTAIVDSEWIKCTQGGYQRLYIHMCQ